MNGARQSVIGADGVNIGLLTAGSGPPLLLVHGGVGQIERWGPIWCELCEHWRVTAMDRRGRGSSGDGDDYSLDSEYGDVAAVASSLAEEAGRPIDVFGHSFGATCTIGAAARSAPFRRIALYEPPGPETVSADWVERVSAMVADGEAGAAMVSLLMEIIGLTSEEVDDLKSVPPDYDILSVLSATLPREGRALLSVDLSALATAVTHPVLLLLGERSPLWAQTITRNTADRIPGSQVVMLPDLGHEAIDAAPDLVFRELRLFFALSGVG